MSLPDEKYRSILKARDFLRDLLDPKKTPRVPKAIRKKAYWTLKHYINEIDLDKLTNKCPDILKKNR